jgi:hypothetical protein
MKRLSKWQWFGLALTLLWIFGSLYSQYSNSYDNAKLISDMAYRTCVEKQTEVQSLDLKICEAEKTKKFEEFINTSDVWTNAFTVAFFPLPFYWLYGYIFLVLGKSFFVGFRSVVNFETLSKTKKAFAYFCYVFFGFNVLFLILILLNIYVDYQIPVHMNTAQFYSAQDHGYVKVRGTWISNKGVDETLTYSPLQISEIVCTQGYPYEKQCIESKASVSTELITVLTAEIIKYDIVSWTPDTLIFKQSGFCYDQIYTIDLNAEVVNGVEKFTTDSPVPQSCKPPEKYAQPVTYRLEDGLKVYNDLRIKKRPWLLKVISSLFGG